MREPAKLRNEARRLALRAIGLLFYGRVVEAEKDWLEAKAAASAAVIAQTYANGFRAGQKAKREGSR